ncbi:hypothetical protein EYZ11_009273 [Aspergillus tanneri]|uniref:Uncharacterized protein n=1 Tax=Aspergillus tanneri TaxID=1220188 RepID=A0A4S3J8B5_9EURO|nr:uncharacterized protein ATNIH1004_001374 [Aspergillus tanneri]KAA8652470.1 hypothetical protein ATNIH1004_001374 [Aspergillus tanneri]THC91273.1 hypothetical protein EYZ11_009273 [Aspergillus tanneri]
MKYKVPEVEEYPETDETTEAQKRKRDASGLEYLSATSGRGPDFGDEKQPPSKTAKTSKVPVEEDSIDEEDEEDDFEDDYERSQGSDDEGQEEDVDEVDEDEDIEPDEEENDERREEDVIDEAKVQRVIERFGRAPLDGTAMAEKPLRASADIVLAMVIDAMLKSRPISRDLSQRAVNKVIEVGYQDIRKLGESSWEERTGVLQDGGYNRYREQGATNLGELAHLVNERYDGDLNNLWEEAHHDRARTRELIKEIKGLGDLGVDLFFNNVQSVWSDIAPFVDTRSLQTAEQVGIGTDLDAIFADLDRDSMKMSRLANGLSAARLEKQQGELLGV